MQLRLTLHLVLLFRGGTQIFVKTFDDGGHLPFEAERVGVDLCCQGGFSQFKEIGVRFLQHVVLVRCVLFILKICF